MIRVSAVLATLNEAENIGPLIEGVLAALATVPDVEPEVVVVDDDSPDGTADVVAALQAERPEVRLVRRRGERGLTSAIRRGVAESRGDVVIWMDCDLSHPPSVIPALLAELSRGADVAVASRYVRGGADRRDEDLHRALSLVINGLSWALLDRRFRDYTSGFVAARRAVLDATRLEGDYGEYFISFIYQALRAGFSVREVPFANYSRRHGESKTATHPLHFARRGRKYLATVARLATGRSPW